jgi:hypothetical protein
MAGNLSADYIQPQSNTGLTILTPAGGTIASINTAGIYSATGNLLISSSFNGLVANTGISGLITSSQIATVANTQVTGTINSNQLSSNVSQFNGMKNRIINGAMVIDQRNAGASVTPTIANATYSVDRFVFLASQASKYTAQQNAGSVTPPVGFSNYLGCTSSSAYSIAAGDYFGFKQPIEGFNTADLMWGTANAKTVTLSFQVYSSLTGTFGGSIYNSVGNRVYPFSYTISSANTWTTINITIAGDTTGTWVGATNGIGLQVFWSLGSGSTNTGTAGAWGTTGFGGANSTISVVGTSGATFYITGVQLEVGSSATGFEYRQYTTELQLCQRYYAKTFPQNVAPANGLNQAYYFGYSGNTVNPSTIWKYPVTMRSAPAVTLFNDRPGGTAGQWNTGTIDTAYARALGSSTEFSMFDNSAVPVTSSNWWLGGATAASEL